VDDRGEEYMEVQGPKSSTKSIGQYAEAAIIAKLLEVGYNVLVPYLGENLRYDLVIEDAGGQLWRIQCKNGKLHNSQEYIEFNASSSYYHHSKDGTTWGRKSYHGQIDYFTVYCPDIRSVYLVPVDHIPHTEGRLRLLPTRNGQEKNIRWAKDYEL
jgi:PD-(D/E)XK endonuclease